MSVLSILFIVIGFLLALLGIAYLSYKATTAKAPIVVNENTSVVEQTTSVIEHPVVYIKNQIGTFNTMVFSGPYSKKGFRNIIQSFYQSVIITEKQFYHEGKALSLWSVVIKSNQTDKIFLLVDESEDYVSKVEAYFTLGEAVKIDQLAASLSNAQTIEVFKPSKLTTNNWEMVLMELKDLKFPNIKINDVTDTYVKKVLGKGTGMYITGVSHTGKSELLRWMLARFWSHERLVVELSKDYRANREEILQKIRQRPEKEVIISLNQNFEHLFRTRGEKEDDLLEFLTDVEATGKKCSWIAAGNTPFDELDPAFKVRFTSVVEMPKLSRSNVVEIIQHAGGTIDIDSLKQDEYVYKEYLREQ